MAISSSLTTSGASRVLQVARLVKCTDFSEQLLQGRARAETIDV